MRPRYNPMLPPGHVFRRAHTASVRAILGDQAPPVHSQGTRFYNVDRWTGRFLVAQMCRWAHLNRGMTPTWADVEEWVRSVNREAIPKRAIYIAATPDKLNWTVARALTGGAYHESFHTKYTCRRMLNVEEVWRIIQPRWKLVDNWGPYMGMLQEWNNIIEDIRIERRGNEEYPGIYQSMCDLQDFILDLEAEMGEGGRSHGEEETQRDEWTALQVVGAAFRDIGLGYDTDKQESALARYAKDQPDAFQMVSEGSLKPLVYEAINLSKFDDLGCIRLSMDVVALLKQLADLKPPPPQQQGQQGSEGQSGEEGDDSEGGAGSSGDSSEEGNSGSGTGSGGEQGEGEDDGEGGSGSSGEGAGDSEGTASGGEGEGDEGQGAGGPGDQPGGNGGGKSGDPSQGEQEAAQDILGQAGAGASIGLHDISSALQEAMQALQEEVDFQVEPGEMPWRPFDQSIDTTSFIKDDIPTSGVRADRLFDEVMQEIMFLRARLHMIIKSVQDVSTEHGLPHGRDLSEPYLVNTMVDLRSGIRPRQAFYVTDEAPEMSLAAAVVIDQSGSMSSIRDLAAKVLMTVVEPLDFLRYPVMALGFRENGKSARAPYSDRDSYHRSTGIHYDIFKSFEERFHQVKWRFGETISRGGTPMSDGIQFGLSALEERPEFHRILFVVTDGMPGGDHGKVMRWQLRQARELGVHVIGVGIGRASKPVRTVFDDHVWATDMNELPHLLLDKLNTILDFRRNRVGRPMDTKYQTRMR